MTDLFVFSSLQLLSNLNQGGTNMKRLLSSPSLSCLKRKAFRRSGFKLNDLAGGGVLCLAAARYK